MMGRPKNILTDALNHYVAEANSGCWIWRSANSGGYGNFSVNKKQYRAHRVIYELLKSPIPQDMTLDHLCRNRICVNPNHLEPVSRRENILRGIGLAAKNGKKSHCLKGHPFDEFNTYLPKDGSRQCKTCRKERKSAEKKERK